MKDEKESVEIQGSIFKFLSSVFSKHNIKCLLVGGYAANALKVQRMTYDIDFMMTRDDFIRIEYELIDAGYIVFNQQDAFVQFNCDKPGFRNLDIILVDKETVDGLLESGQEVSIANESFMVPSPKHLIAMKLHSMSGNKNRELKDFPDVVQLLVENKLDPLSDNVKTLFDKYNASHLYNRVVEAVRNLNEE